MIRYDASIAALHRYADMIQKIRDFFYKKKVLEVFTPLLCSHSVTDIHIESLSVRDHCQRLIGFLQTSPEYAMKKLMAKHPCCMYQITKAFRSEEIGAHHSMEFTMLEWYRMGFDSDDLIQEVDEFFQFLCHAPPLKKISYEQVFLSHFSVNPHDVSIEIIRSLCMRYGLHSELKSLDEGLQYLMSVVIGPVLGKDLHPWVIFDFPVTQAALARICNHRAKRFEVYWRGLELGNGYHELNDPKEQKRRLMRDQAIRASNKQPHMEYDESFLDCLHQLPDCSGIALGLDRVFYLIDSSSNII